MGRTKRLEERRGSFGSHEGYQNTLKRETQIQTTVRYYLMPTRNTLQHTHTHKHTHTHTHTHTQKISVGEDVEKLESLDTAGRNGKWHSHPGKWFGRSLKKLNIELPYDGAVPLVGIYPSELKTYVHTKTTRECPQQHYSEEPTRGNNPNAHQLTNG